MAWRRVVGLVPFLQEPLGGFTGLIAFLLLRGSEVEQFPLHADAEFFAGLGPQSLPPEGFCLGEKLLVGHNCHFTAFRFVGWVFWGFGGV